VSEETISRRLTFDFETEPLSEAFFKARTAATRLKHMPALRIGGVYDESQETYRFYGPSAAKALIEDLNSGDQIVSFNGKAFDLLVLRCHYNLSKENLAILNAKHVDLLEIVERENGWRVGLDKLARLNLGESKMVHGRDMANLDPATLIEACRSDIWQTHRLFLKWLLGDLQYPSGMRQHDNVFEDIPLIGHHLPPGNYMSLDINDMTEGQMAEYLAGTWGFDEDTGEFIEM
jgi:hypothetical protein